MFSKPKIIDCKNMCVRENIACENYFIMTQLHMLKARESMDIMTMCVKRGYIRMLAVWQKLRGCVGSSKVLLYPLIHQKKNS